MKIILNFEKILNDIQQSFQKNLLVVRIRVSVRSSLQVYQVETFVSHSHPQDNMIKYLNCLYSVHQSVYKKIHLEIVCENMKFQ